MSASSAACWYRFLKGLVTLKLSGTKLCRVSVAESSGFERPFSSVRLSQSRLRLYSTKHSPGIRIITASACGNTAISCAVFCLRLFGSQLNHLGRTRHPWRGWLLPRFAPSLARAALSILDARLSVTIPFAVQRERTALADRSGLSLPDHAPNSGA